MKMLSKNSKGVSLLEAFIASIVFIVAVAAVFNILEGLRKPAVNNEQKTKAALVLSGFLDEMRAKISADDQASTAGAYASSGGELYQGPHGPITIPVQGVDYNISYTVTVLPNTARQVDATITWPDAM